MKTYSGNAGSNIKFFINFQNKGIVIPGRLKHNFVQATSRDANFNHSCEKTHPIFNENSSKLDDLVNLVNCRIRSCMLPRGGLAGICANMVGGGLKEGGGFQEGGVSFLRVYTVISKASAPYKS